MKAFYIKRQTALLRAVYLKLRKSLYWGLKEKQSLAEMFQNLKND